MNSSLTKRVSLSAKSKAWGRRLRKDLSNLIPCRVTARHLVIRLKHRLSPPTIRRQQRQRDAAMKSEERLSPSWYKRQSTCPGELLGNCGRMPDRSLNLPSQPWPRGFRMTTGGLKLFDPGCNTGDGKTLKDVYWTKLIPFSTIFTNDIPPFLTKDETHGKAGFRHCVWGRWNTRVIVFFFSTSVVHGYARFLQKEKGGNKGIPPPGFSDRPEVESHQFWVLTFFSQLRCLSMRLAACCTWGRGGNKDGGFWDTYAIYDCSFTFTPFLLSAEMRVASLLRRTGHCEVISYHSLITMRGV